MTAYDQRSYEISGSGTAPSMKQAWFKAAQTVEGWGTTPSMTGSADCTTVHTYYQRVYDNINTFWCYYSGSTVNESPGMTDTTPHISGDISGYSIVYATEKIVCS